MPEHVCVFAPDPLLTVTVEAGSDGDEIHLHAGGQGFWVAQMIANLGVGVSLCGPFGGESGRVVRSLVERGGITVRAIRTAGSNGAYVHDRRSGDRVTVAETPPDPLGRHELDDLYGAALVLGLESDVAVLAGPGPWETPVVPADHYRRLAADLRANGATVVADLRGEPLSCALAGGVTVLKISHEELLADGRVENDGEDDLFEAMAGLRREGADHVVVTRAGDPALALIDDEPLAIDPPALEVVDHRGAGDSLTAGLAAGLARGLDLSGALRLGAAAAGLNVTRRGLATGDRREIDRLADHIELHPRHDGARRPA
ncbi:MAG TPA: PfkB family carbohydrate kinase [Acidimicrobiia bacterium]|nr:PfkB family carbohydrate kinase [Acidimicrobiia bacterium]